MVTKLHEAGGGTDIIVLGADALHLLFLGYLLSEKSKNALAWQKLPDFLGYVVNGRGHAHHLLVMDDALHLLHLPVDL